MILAKILISESELHFLPVQTRVPLKFGAEILTHVTCLRVRLRLNDAQGKSADGWGETPLNVEWVWPSTLSSAARLSRLKEFSTRLVGALSGLSHVGHPMELSHDFMGEILPGILEIHNRHWLPQEPMPWLAALVCYSACDLALHDGFGILRQRPVFETYGQGFFRRDLAAFLGGDSRFEGRYPADFLLPKRRETLFAWHLVGGLDPLEQQEVDSTVPGDSYPAHLLEWIARDGLQCLKIKLRGNDPAWDYTRLVRVGNLSIAHGGLWLTADFNCMVRDPRYVTDILDQLRTDHPRIYGMLLYVEQPFPYDLKAHPIDVRCVSARKPLFLDESAHDWQHVQLGRELGWSGVALKTCKTLTGALLSAAWAQASGMELMVQDLTNPMLAQISHVTLAAHLPTIMGVETNSMQFYPDASHLEARVHPGLYRRRHGQIDLSSVHGPGLGYRIDEIDRKLDPENAAC